MVALKVKLLPCIKISQQPLFFEWMKPFSFSLVFVWSLPAVFWSLIDEFTLMDGFFFLGEDDRDNDFQPRRLLLLFFLWSICCSSSVVSIPLVSSSAIACLDLILYLAFFNPKNSLQTSTVSPTIPLDGSGMTDDRLPNASSPFVLETVVCSFTQFVLVWVLRGLRVQYAMPFSSV